MNEIKAGGRVGTAERIAVMAALNIAHELLTTQGPQTSVNGFDFNGVQRRMAVMQATLEQVLAPQTAK